MPEAVEAASSLRLRSTAREPRAAHLARQPLRGVSSSGGLQRPPPARVEPFRGLPKPSHHGGTIGGRAVAARTAQRPRRPANRRWRASTRTPLDRCAVRGEHHHRPPHRSRPHCRPQCRSRSTDPRHSRRPRLPYPRRVRCLRRAQAPRRVPTRHQSPTRRRSLPPRQRRRRTSTPRRTPRRRRRLQRPPPSSTKITALTPICHA